MHGHRGSMPGSALRKIFDYILIVLFLGCQCEALPIDKTPAGLSKFIPSVSRIFRGWTAEGYRDADLLGSVCKLNEDRFLDASVIRSDGTLDHRREWTRPRSRSRIALMSILRPHPNVDLRVNDFLIDCHWTSSTYRWSRKTRKP